MVRKLHKKACQQCRHSLTGSLTGTFTEVMLQKTQLKHAKEGLVNPSAQLVCAVEIMECVFKMRCLGSLYTWTRSIVDSFFVSTKNLKASLLSVLGLM